MDTYSVQKAVSRPSEAPRINMIGPWLAGRFGKKMVKLSLPGGTTCPNRDGTCGTGGCLFCSAGGSGENASDIDGQIALLSPKWKNAGYLAYFQSFTATYGPVEELREKFYGALADPRIEGIAIATRPDCLGDEVLDLLAEIASSHFLWVELGLQTIHEETARRINRGYPLSVYDEAMARLRALGIPVVTHLILGLPGETREDMEASVRYAVRAGTWGLKLHLLNVVRGSRLAAEMPDYMPFDAPEEYISLVADLLEIIPPEVVIHRLSGDARAEELIAPKWSYRKRLILNGIEAELKRRGTFQGAKCEDMDGKERR